MEDRDRGHGGRVGQRLNMALAAGTRRSMIELTVVMGVVWLAMQWWGGRKDDDRAAAIVAEARAGDIIMFSSTTCAYCEQARQWLTAHQVPFSECFIERDAACAARYRATGAAGTPTLLVRGQRQLGFNPQLLAQALEGGAAP